MFKMVIQKDFETTVPGEVIVLDGQNKAIRVAINYIALQSLSRKPYFSSSNIQYQDKLASLIYVLIL